MSSSADIYERQMVPHYFAPLAAEVVERARPQPGDHVLDVACGTGVVARRIWPLVGVAGRVVGLDLSPAMLAVARAKAAQEGQQIEWREGRAEQLPFPDASFDLVVCQHGLQFMPDRLAAVAEMRRVLRDDGRVVVSATQGLQRQPFDQQLNDVIERRFGIAPFRQVHSLGDSDELRSILEEAGLRQVAIDPVSFMSRYHDPEDYLAMRIHVIVAAVPSMQQKTPDELDDLMAEVRAALMPVLQDYVVDGEVVIPSPVQIAHAVR